MNKIVIMLVMISGVVTLPINLNARDSKEYNAYAKELRQAEKAYNKCIDSNRYSDGNKYAYYLGKCEKQFNLRVANAEDILNGRNSWWVW